MIAEFPDTRRKFLIAAVVLTCIVVFLAWLGYQASEEWQRSAVRAAERRADEVAALLIGALTRDMQGAQQTLQQLDQENVVLHPPYDTANTVAQVFSRFPYPESFFVWRGDETGKQEAALFNRTDRLPQWSSSDTPSDGYPVTIATNSAIAKHLSEQARHAAQPHERFAFFNTTVGETPYQVVARTFYSGGSAKQAIAIVGFTVNLEWIQQFYLPELISQVQRISGRTETASISLAILDDRGKSLTGNDTFTYGPYRERQFPLAFFNSAAVPQGKLQSLPLRQWTVRINAAEDSLLGAANSSARNTRGLILFATAISIVGILFSLYLLHSHFHLESMKAEFVARASHELKTPLASISLVGDTLLKHRYNSEASVKEYGSVLLKESSRLAKLVENLLTFSRITGNQNVYSMKLTNIGDTVSEALERLRPQLGEKRFDLRFQGHRDLKVRCDREAITQAFENVIENAIRYSGDGREIGIVVDEVGRGVNICIKDRGRGIAPEDIPHVFNRFYRGKNVASSAGSGLGLSIAQKIIKDHGGRISIESSSGEGTLVTIVLPDPSR